MESAASAMVPRGLPAAARAGAAFAPVGAVLLAVLALMVPCPTPTATSRCGEVVTSRWLDPSHAGVDLGFPTNA